MGSVQRRLRKQSSRNVFPGAPPTPLHQTERDALLDRFDRLRKKAGVTSDVAEFRTEVLMRHMRGERRDDALSRWAADVMALRADEGFIRERCEGT